MTAARSFEDLVTSAVVTASDSPELNADAERLLVDVLTAWNRQVKHAAGLARTNEALRREVTRQRAEIAAVRLRLGETPPADVPEPAGCPIPGACVTVREIQRLRGEVVALENMHAQAAGESAALLDALARACRGRDPAAVAALSEELNAALVDYEEALAALNEGLARLKAEEPNTPAHQAARYEATRLEDLALEARGQIMRVATRGAP